jgi:hypothetical protein
MSGHGFTQRDTTMRSVLLFLLAAALAPAGGSLHAQDTRTITFSGDLRTGYFHLERDHRDGQSSTARDLRARIRPALNLRLSPTVEARLRLAGRYSTAQDGFDFHLDAAAPAPDGLELGQTTIDEAYLRLRPGARWNVRLGRMQTKFALNDLMAKSLDRGDSPNTDITWMDGGHVAFSAGGWRSHLILQHNSRRGPSSTLRPPLNFEDDASRVTVFAAIESDQTRGAITQRGLDLTVIPRALSGGGDAPEDYIALVGRGMLTWPLTVTGSSFALGGELGYAPNTPTRAELNLGDAGSGDVSGLAYQLSGTLADVLPGHRIGLVYARVQPGWLLAPDFRNNDELVELRYQLVIARGHSVEARVRRRDDLHRPLGSIRDRRDNDLYVRYSLRF